MAKKTVSAYQNPLDRYLKDTDPDDPDNLALLARRLMVESFDFGKFKDELVAKLKRLKYKPARIDGNEETFHAGLFRTRSLDVLLHDETLKELRKCLLLKEIVALDRKFKNEKRAADGERLRCHNTRANRIWKDLDTIGKIVERNGLLYEADTLVRRLNRLYHDHMKMLLISTRYRTPPAALLSDHPVIKKHHGPRNEDTATLVAVYKVLSHKLQTRDSKKKGIFNAFLYDLAELICAPKDVSRLTLRDSIRKAVEHSR